MNRLTGRQSRLDTLDIDRPTHINLMYHSGSAGSAPAACALFAQGLAAGKRRDVGLAVTAGQRHRALQTSGLPCTAC